MLLVCTLAALILSNSRWADPFLSTWETQVGFRVGPFDTGRSLKGWINDGLMTLFFFHVALELKRELVLGELGHPRTAALSVAAALGGMLLPAGLYPGEFGSPVTVAVFVGFVLGKPIGVVSFSWLAVRTGVAGYDPHGMTQFFRILETEQQGRGRHVQNGTALRVPGQA